MSVDFAGRHVGRRGKIYVVGCAELPNVFKVGFTTNPTTRMGTLQVAFPYTLKLLALRDGSQADEKRIHRILDQYRLRGEWFGDLTFETLEQHLPLGLPESRDIGVSLQDVA